VGDPELADRLVRSGGWRETGPLPMDRGNTWEFGLVIRRRSEPPAALFGPLDRWAQASLRKLLRTDTPLLLAQGGVTPSAEIPT